TRGAQPLHEQFGHPYSIILQRARLDLAAAHGESAARGRTVPASPPASTPLLAEHGGGGCAFAMDCPRRALLGVPSICESEAPPLAAVGADHRVACHFRDGSGIVAPLLERGDRVAIS